MISRLLSILCLLIVAACAATSKDTNVKGPLLFKQSGFASLDGWNNDDLSDFMKAYNTSCARILKKSPEEKFGSDPAWGTYGPWQNACRKSQSVNGNDTAAVRQFLKDNFKVVQATEGGNARGLFTGYYEFSLQGSRTKHGAYQHPLLARPKDLVMVDLGEFRDELKGQRIAGRVIDGKLKPFENRAAIVSGKLAGATPLVWLDDPHDAFFVQVQGSGLVKLDDGSIMRVGYDGQNGHPYYAIGRELVKRGIFGKDEVSMDTIRTWLVQNPEKADELLNTNPSYVFFREMPDDGTGAGPQGGEGVKLTATRSIAIDRSIHPYGFPLWLSADYTGPDGKPIRRLMMAQDTGGAIRGPVRGDFFWGSGQQAEAKAGPMKAQGQYWFLMPK